MNTCVAAQQPLRALDLFRDMRDVGRVRLSLVCVSELLLNTAAVCGIVNVVPAVATAVVGTTGTVPDTGAFKVQNDLVVQCTNCPPPEHTGICRQPALRRTSAVAVTDKHGFRGGHLVIWRGCRMGRKHSTRRYSWFIHLTRSRVFFSTHTKARVFASHHCSCSQHTPKLMVSTPPIPTLIFVVLKNANPGVHRLVHSLDTDDRVFHSTPLLVFSF